MIPVEERLDHLYDSPCENCVHAQCYYEITNHSWTVYCDRGHTTSSENCRNFRIPGEMFKETIVGRL